MDQKIMDQKNTRNQKRVSCDHCGKIFGEMTSQQRSSHSRWCEKNPYFEENKKQMKICMRGEKSKGISAPFSRPHRPAVPSYICCPHCGSSLKGLSLGQPANHVRWCLNNPSRSLRGGRKGEAAWLNTPESIAKRGAKISEAHQRGAYKGVARKSLESRIKNGKLKPSAETLEKMKKSAQAAKHQRVCKSTHDFTDKRGRTFKFDSKWEDAVAVRLDDLDVEWNRPGPIAYRIDGKDKLYFPDFYLPAYDLHVDPKNSYCCQVQSPKLAIVCKLIRLVILKTLAECKGFDPENLGTTLS